MEAAANAVISFAKTAATKLSAPPPKLFFPSYLNFPNFFKRWGEVQRKEGFAGAYNKLRMETTFRKGTLVGKDYNGNKYYEDRNAPYGRTRWVEYPTVRGWWMIDNKFDGSMVRPAPQPLHSRPETAAKKCRLRRAP